MPGAGTTATPTRADRRARGAVMALFAVNGATYNSLVPRFPALRDGLGLSNTELGSAIAAFPGAALLVGVLAGPLIARLGSGRVAAAVSLVGALLLPLVAFAPAWWALAAALFLLGVTDAWTDAAMNAHGLVVQERYGRSIMNGLHATWSVAAVGAGLLGAAAAGLGFPVAVHLAVVGALLAVTSAVAWRAVLPPEHHSDVVHDGPGLRGVLTSWRTVAPLLAVAGLMVCSGAVEDSSASWGAVYLRDDLAVGAFVAGLPFVAFQTTMTLGRFAGDRVVDRFEPVRVARTGALVAMVALTAALLLAHPWAAVIGWALAGLGVATLFPLAFAAAGTVPGVRAGDGIAVVGFLARLGFLTTPPVIGAIADASSVGTGLLVVPVAALGAAVLAGALRRREATPPARGEPSAG